MTWSYDPNDLGTSVKDDLRLEIGDTDVNNQLLQDQEIEWFITQENSYWGQAARCCEAIARFFMTKADVKLGRALAITYTRMAEQYLDMAGRLRLKASAASVPYMGGVLIADKLALGQNTGVTQPAFTRNMMLNPWTGGYTPDTLGVSPGGWGGEGDEAGWDIGELGA